MTIRSTFRETWFYANQADETVRKTVDRVSAGSSARRYSLWVTDLPQALRGWRADSAYRRRPPRPRPRRGLRPRRQRH